MTFVATTNQAAPAPADFGPFLYMDGSIRISAARVAELERYERRVKPLMKENFDLRSAVDSQARLLLEVQKEAADARSSRDRARQENADLRDFIKQTLGFALAPGGETVRRVQLGSRPDLRITVENRGGVESMVTVSKEPPAVEPAQARVRAALRVAYPMARERDVVDVASLVHQLVKPGKTA